MLPEIKIRAVKIEDAQALLDIYGYYVENTAITYEYQVPTLSEFKSRILNITSNYPYLVAELNQQIVGYAYANQFQSRPGYGWNAEMTVYLDVNKRGYGIGEKLYNVLESILKEQGVVNLIALITPPPNETECSIYNSISFHKKMGYRFAGEIEFCGYKFCRWFNTVYMYKRIGVPMQDMNTVKSFDDVREKFDL